MSLACGITPGHPLRGQGVEQVAWGSISGDRLPPVSLPGGRKTLAVPLDALLPEEVEEVNLLEGGGLDVRVLAEEVVEEGVPHFGAPMTTKAGSVPSSLSTPSFAARSSFLRRKISCLFFFARLVCSEPRPTPVRSGAPSYALYHRRQPEGRHIAWLGRAENRYNAASEQEGKTI